MPTLRLSITFLLLSASGAFAHGNDAISAHHWTFDPWILIPLVLAGGFYAFGTFRLWARVGLGKGLRTWQAVAYATGWLTLGAALISPLHWLGEQLFTAHMIEHEIVMAVAAPLIVAARPYGTMIWALPHRLRLGIGWLLRRSKLQDAGKWLSGGGIATVVHGVAIWAWHVPVLFDASVLDVTLHRVQHLSFFVTGLLFWWSVLKRSGSPIAASHLFITMLHTSTLGALLVLAPRVFYSAQTIHSAEWGLTPLEDQQLAGIIMWVPGAVVYAGTALVMTALWIRQSRMALRLDHASEVS